MRYLHVFVLFVLMMYAGVEGLEAQGNSDYLPGTIVVKAKAGYAANLQKDPVLGALFGRLGTYSFERLYPRHRSPQEAVNAMGDSLIDLSLYYQLKYKAPIKEWVVVQALQKHEGIAWAERRPRSRLLYMPNDSLLSKQYYPRIIQAFDAWDIEPGDSNVVIGIVDTGTDLYGEDLFDNIKFNYQDTIDGIDNDNDGYVDNFMGWDLGMNDNNPSSYLEHHGCFTTGIGSAVTNNGRGIAGMAYQCKYLPVKTNSDAGVLVSDWEGLVYAADHGCQIINNSWGGKIYCRYGQDMVNYATYNKNALVVAAAGNDATDEKFYPAALDNVISCSATDSNDVYAFFTSYGPTVDLAAPGYKVFSTWVSNIYFASNGTSFAAPGVSAVAALVKSQRPWLNALQLGEQVKWTTDRIDTLAANQALAGMLGTGRLNALKALTDTMKPAIQFRHTREVRSHNGSSDTLFFSGEWVNLLKASTTALKVTASAYTSGINILNPIYHPGALGTLATANNYSNPFIILIDPSVPANYEAVLKLSYEDSNYQAYEYFTFRLKPNYQRLDTNNIRTWVASDGQVGFTGPDFRSGRGLYYKNSKNLLSRAGLLVGISTAKVSDNIYGENGLDQDFTTTANTVAVVPATLGDQEYYGGYNDNGGGFNALHISVRQHSYAYGSQAEDLVFMQYTIVNNNNSALNNLYAGFYADFDITPYYYQNKAYWDSLHQMAYTQPASGGPVAGIMLLDSLPIQVYNFDNDGSDNSINIYDGLLDYEKYSALQGSRTEAGTSMPDGNDVSNLISAGPLSLAAHDSITLTFALLAGDFVQGLQQTAQEAHNIFYNVAGMAGQGAGSPVHIRPNPFSGRLNMEIQSTKQQELNFVVRDVQGRVVSCHRLAVHQGANTIKLQLNHLKTGVYLYRLTGEKLDISGKLIKK